MAIRPSIYNLMEIEGLIRPLYAKINTHRLPLFPQIEGILASITYLLYTPLDYNGLSYLTVIRGYLGV